MKKVGIITFHAAYNYGSMLQAYALQQVILSMGYDCEIINFRSPAQKRQYKPIFVVGSFYGRCVRFIIQAASDDPPPSPAPAGICLYMCISTGNSPG